MEEEKSGVLKPIVWYKFDDPNDLGKDSSGNSYSATNYGATYDSGKNCKQGDGCVHFSASGTQQYMTVDNRLDLGTIQQQSGITVSFWGYMTELSGYWARYFDFGGRNSTYFYHGGGANLYNWLFAAPSTSTYPTWLQLDIYGGKGYFSVPFSKHVISSWHHFVFSISKNGSASANTWSVWIDNELVCDACHASGLTSIPMDERGWYIARSHWEVDGKTDGGMDDFRIYDQALTALQVAELTEIYYDSVEYNPVSTPSKAYWFLRPVYVNCQMNHTWDDVIHGQLAKNQTFKSGGLGKLMTRGEFEVWVCSYQDECAKPRNPFCYVFNEQQKLFIPW
ncbi:hypothetical protein GUITHDRAFT_136318 [Guillardia theta CCMP2712]|uniref:LamG-like jellyroll fold domain-containing protein n=1 Tax=Guillardia theta (strain CCMP2712) TaxID=905079 RepID=L1JKX6_GUITC|nr:hypothetical protein GUITHDRAFT_136318 [Guillardia theta CCMP2712]EKX49158.1 hypothetical protein GUITHDRAFT_136318 [Guillardia theta CCMP2712]|eukprot:XP_005836138.1 hypothetical protein GUITHDRAFT_136318 [Guillardia theta CCMP2712]